jgi:hypothetical protein
MQQTYQYTRKNDDEARRVTHEAPFKSIFTSSAVILRQFVGAV